MNLPDGWKTIPCPECGEPSGAHLGTCDLSVVKSGRFWLTIAVPIDAIGSEQAAELGRKALELA